MYRRDSMASSWFSRSNRALRVNSRAMRYISYSSRKMPNSEMDTASTEMIFSRPTSTTAGFSGIQYTRKTA